MSIQKKVAKYTTLLLIWNTIQYWNNKRNLFTNIDLQDNIIEPHH